MKVLWHHVYPDDVFQKMNEENTLPIYSFELNEKKSWKGQLIRGHDIAEMIAEDFYEFESIALRKLVITSPKPYAGVYDIQPEWNPSFKALKIQEITTISASEKID